MRSWFVLLAGTLGLLLASPLAPPGYAHELSAPWARTSLQPGAGGYWLTDGDSMPFRAIDTWAASAVPPIIAARATGQSGMTTPVGPRWHWEGNVVDGVLPQPLPADPSRPYWLQLLADGRAVVALDCNAGSGSYTLEGSSLTFGPIATTLMACPPGSRATEYALVLELTRGWRFDGNALLLDLAPGGSLRFRLDESAALGQPPATAPAMPLGVALVGPAWQWERTLLNLATLVPNDPSRYTLQFQPDGTVTAQVDCNRGVGTYALDGDRLTFGPLATTRVACPPGSLGTEFGRDLAQVTRARLDGDTLILDLGFDSGVMRFRHAPGAAAQ